MLALHSGHPAVYIQVKLIREKFQAALGDDARLVDINTIDGFQVVLCSLPSVCHDLAAVLKFACAILVLVFNKMTSGHEQCMDCHAKLRVRM